MQLHLTPSPSLTERFWEKVNKDGPAPAHCPDLGPCWVWTGATFKPQGYGVLSFNKKVLSAHRVSYELHYGPIPHNAHVCHHCDNPACVRPSHFYAGSPQTNADDRRTHGNVLFGDAHPARLHPERLARGEAQGSAKLTEVNVLEIRRLRAQGIILRVIGEQYGVSLSTIHLVCKGAVWQHVT